MKIKKLNKLDACRHNPSLLDFSNPRAAKNLHEQSLELNTGNTGKLE